MVSFEELALHNAAEDCWVAFHGVVYDLTNYTAQGHHPAGAFLITRLAGTDGTEDYTRFHSQPLLDDVEDDIVGTLMTINRPA